MEHPMSISLPTITRTVVLAAGLGIAALGGAGAAGADTGHGPAQLHNQGVAFAPAPAYRHFCMPGTAINCRTGRVIPPHLLAPYNPHVHP
jgi:hypothetical protein